MAVLYIHTGKIRKSCVYERVAYTKELRMMTSTVCKRPPPAPRGQSGVMVTKMEKRDLYAEVTQKIIAALETGVAPWVKPWTAGAPIGGALPHNYLTKRPYRGINFPLLWSAGFESNAWMTYKQAQSIGAHVRKGERGSMIVFFKPYKIREQNASGKQEERTIPLLRAFTVFNVAQIDGLPESAPAMPVVSNFSAADAALAQARIDHGGDRACYIPALDAIRMPHVSQFRSIADYYSTALHELTHWTASRCAREFGKKFGDTAYAREELVAEMGAAFLCGQFGIEGKLQHAEYIGNWIAVLKGDKRAVLMAASAAQKAADFINQGSEVSDEGDESEMACAA
jgi:antirestriction protein ArdC